MGEKYRKNFKILCHDILRNIDERQARIKNIKTIIHLPRQPQTRGNALVHLHMRFARASAPRGSLRGSYPGASLGTGGVWADEGKKKKSVIILKERKNKKKQKIEENIKEDKNIRGMSPQEEEHIKEKQHTEHYCNGLRQWPSGTLHKQRAQPREWRQRRVRERSSFGPLSFVNETSGVVFPCKYWESLGVFFLSEDPK